MPWTANTTAEPERKRFSRNGDDDDDDDDEEASSERILPLELELLCLLPNHAEEVEEVKKRSRSRNNPQFADFFILELIWKHVWRVGCVFEEMHERFIYDLRWWCGSTKALLPWFKLGFLQMHFLSLTAYSFLPPIKPHLIKFSYPFQFYTFMVFLKNQILYVTTPADTQETWLNSTKSI